MKQPKYDFPFTNKTVFALVMRDPKLCQGLLQTIFPGREIAEVRLHEEYVRSEDTIIAGIRSKQVRLDVRFSDNAAWYDIEMQVENRPYLPKRTRYYHSILDTDTLNQGQHYSELKPIYVIFLCCFDFFGEDRSVYTFSMREHETHLSLGDETYTMLLNSRVSDAAEVPTPLRELFRYLNDGIVPEENDLVKQIDRSVESWNTKGRSTIMTFEQELGDVRKESIEIGIKQGTYTTLADLVIDKLLSLEEASARAGLPTEQFQVIVDERRDTYNGQ